MHRFTFRGLRMQPVIPTFVLLLMKLVLFRQFLFHGLVWSTLGADFFALCVLLGLFELIVPQKGKRIAFALINLIVSLILFSSSIYYSHFGSLPTYTALLQLDQVMQIRTSVQSTIEWKDYIFFADLIIMMLLLFVPKRRSNRSIRIGIAWKVSVLLIAILGFYVSSRYIQANEDISNETVQAQQLGFLNYQVAAVIKDSREESRIRNGNLSVTTATIKQLEETFTYQSKKAGQPNLFGAAKGKNLIIVQMEAFQNFPIHLSLGGQELTPNLNKLADEGLYFPHVYQQIGQGNTSDAEFMSNTSIYPTGTIPMSTGYGDRVLPSLPRLLDKQGYETNTFHVNAVTFWDRIKLYPALNFDHYYDKPYYTNDHFNDFGASDEELYKVGIDKVSALADADTPFYAQFVTVSSHFPFTVPDKSKKITVPESMQGTQLGNYLTAINYTDYAVGTLIDRLKQEGLWDNSVVVFYGDHFGLQPQDNDPEWVSSQLDITYDSKISRFNIPLIIHVPGMEEGQVVDQSGGQLDILPTIANLMGISLQDEQFTAFGHDLMNIDHNVFGIRYYLPTGSFINDDILFVPGKGFDDGTATSLRTLKPVKDITPYKADYDYVMNLMRLSDEYVELLPKRGP
ncbi:LTA synthase family protein [Paenibacillus sp. PR3]|uniref:LTA synthase family protein n=1 Tax=Paenibacillus terricola TaxID=2763503 RepID=A0ABR8MXH6_9BACL|nr:LTA synthase family protein [Paenibacillus terricola]MBD3919732.1 LTA synthase family protein [Paenibacillus terricola]